ncbi:MAG: radical SAM protein [Acidobacteria bacterium]|nr:radical SAM protein [Acidobacteriota bacterium]
MQLKSALSDLIYKPGKRIRALPMLILMPVEGCNCKCRMCDIWQKKATQIMPLSQINQLLTDASNLKTNHLVLTGGEALLHPEIDEILKLAKGLGMKVTLLTSGLLIRKKADLISHYVNELVVSLDGPERCHDLIRGVPGAFALTRSGLLALNPRPRIIARHVVQKDTFAHILETVKAAKDWTADHISFLTVDPDSQAFNHTEAHPDLSLNEAECQELSEKLARLAREEGGFVLEPAPKLFAMVQYFRAQLGIADFPGGPCNAPWNSCVVETNGRVQPCFFQHYGGDDPVGVGLSAQLNHQRAIRFRSALDVANDSICKTCVCRLWTPWRNRRDV